MNILAIETSSKNFSIAVARGGRVVRYRNMILDKVLESSIIPAIDTILNKAGLSLSDVDGYAVGLGPGSFTSLRVGVSTVKALAFSTRKPVVGIPSLDVIAANVTDHGSDEICVITDARRGMVYAGLYARTDGGAERKGELALTTVQEVLDRVHGTTLFVGDALALYRGSIEDAYAAAAKKTSSCRALFAPEKCALAQASKLSELACRRFSKKVYDDSGALVPVYLYAQDCQVQPKI